MASTVGHVYVGAVKSAEGGHGGVFRQAVGSQRWDALENGLPDGAQVHAITVHPDESADVWSITIHPTDRRTIYAGYGPTGVYRSDDGGDHWKKLPDPGLPDRVHMTFPCRVMRLDVDPARPDDVYACIEANGAMRSRNR